MDSIHDLKIGVTQAESKRALALVAHLRQIVDTVFDGEGRVFRPTDMDQAELLLCSASLRILFFDSPASSILLDFLTQHQIDIKVETLETNIAMAFFAQVDSNSNGHVTDLCVSLLFDEKMRGRCELNKQKQFVVFTDETDAYSSLAKKPEVWRPVDLQTGQAINSPSFSCSGKSAQFITVTRRQVPIAEWGDVRLGYLKNIPIRRKTIICYVANQLGGVHYDSARLPSGEDERSEFKLLAQAYDWEKKAIMHAGLASVALACIEIAAHPDIRKILWALSEFDAKRRSKLLRGESPTWGVQSGE